MKATEARFLDFLKQSSQFVIPIYQRTYSWTEHECRQLWDDILRTGSNDAISAHFIGSIVYIEKGLSNLTRQEPMLVIDGQQRLTTITLLLAVLARVLEKREEGEREPADGFSPRKILNYYLINPEEEGERHYKLLLSQTDRDTLLAVVSGADPPKVRSLRIVENRALFASWIASCKGDLATVCKGLAKLVIVDIALNRDQDNPQLIFESMNSTGRELTQADLIRNFILMGLEPQLQTRLYEQYWRPMESDFGQEAYSTHFDSFMRHFLTVRTGEIPNIRDVYTVFKTVSRSPEAAQAGVESLVADIRTFAGYYCAIELGQEHDPDLELAFHDLRELRVDVAYPLLLEMYHDYARGVLPRADFLKIVRLVEAYVFRRAICAIPTNSLNKTFATFTKAIKQERYLESAQAHLLSLPSYRRFPTDDEFQRDLQTRDLYSFPRRSYWLRRLENYRRKEIVQLGEYTIEHILPQNPDLPAGWKATLGPEWERVQKTWLHTLGNLTLTRYNAEYGDRPFAEKRDMKGGFKGSPLNLNTGLGQLEQWNEDTIKARATKLAGLALDVWSGPTLPDEVRKRYQPSVSTSGYTIEHYPQLLTGPVSELFQEFRAKVLALDPCVTEEFRQVYVAYKAETNFVDVVPQAKRLRLSLNVGFHDINDTKHVCKDVSGIGRWGNGDVQVGLSTSEELPYIMGLVRQAFEQQMGANEAD